MQILGEESGVYSPPPKLILDIFAQWAVTQCMQDGLHFYMTSGIVSLNLHSFCP